MAFKTIILILTCMLTGLGAQADQKTEELVKQVLATKGTCENFVRYDDQNLYLGFGTYKLGLEEPRGPLASEILVTPLNNPAAEFALKTLDSVIEVLRDGQNLWVLTYSGLELWDLNTKARTNVYQTYAKTEVMKYREHARGMSRFLNLLVIAHGRLGVSVFDMDKKRLVFQDRLLQSQLPIESQAMDVTVVSDMALILFDSFSLVDPSKKQPFRGIIAMDMKTNTVVMKADGLAVGADSLALAGDDLWISFMGYPIGLIKLPDLFKTQSTAGVNIKFPNINLGHPRGKGVLLEKDYLTCYLKYSTVPGGKSRKVPLVYPRSEIGI
jgi:hypothetical protein